MMLIVHFYSFLTCSNMLIDVSSSNTKSHTFCILSSILYFSLFANLSAMVHQRRFLEMSTYKPQTPEKIRSGM